MLDITELLKYLPAVDHRKHSSNLKHKLVFTDKIFTSNHIYKLLEHINYIEKNNIKDFTMKIVINVEIISDEAVLILFEAIIYYLIKNNICNIIYTFAIDRRYLGYKMFVDSNLFKYNTRIINKKEYIDFFEKEIHISVNQYRKLCINNEKNSKGVFLSTLLGDINVFLSTYDISEECADDLAYIVVEVIDNALNHSDSDCLLDVKVIKDPINKYTCVNVTTIAIGPILVSTTIKEYIEAKDKSKYTTKNEVVLKAYENHKKYFDEKYDINSFSLISAFQKYVTTRENSKNSGGTGLTTLIEQLRVKASKDYCYVLAGNDIIYFKEGYLDLTDEGFIGFNKENDYINKKPDVDVVYKINNFFNGVIYNLSFIIDKKEEKIDE